MPKPRKLLVSLEATPYYHCVSRHVRRTFLCGEGALSGRSFEHRRQWIRDRMAQLAAVFALDSCAYAVMSNHYHVLLRVDRAQTPGWDDIEVVRCWRMLFTGHPLAQRFLEGKALSKAESRLLKTLIAEWRSRLLDISWHQVPLARPCASRHSVINVCPGWLTTETF